MREHYQQIYTHQAEAYDRLVSREDHAGNLLPALQSVAPHLSDCEVVEFGAGTGRLTCLLAPQVQRVRAFDKYPSMLAVARRRLREQGTTNWELAVGENQTLPAADASADLAIEGWSFGHLLDADPPDRFDQVDAALSEMARVTRPSGLLVLLETLGTGSTQPAPPNPRLAAWYERLETHHGFRRHWCRTDYRFASLAEAEELTSFFFGPTMAERVRQENWLTLPECTGIWWRRKSSL